VDLKQAKDDLTKHTIERDEARQERDKRPNITRQEFADYQSPEQVAEKERLVREQIENKYRSFINPTDQKKIIELAQQAGCQFTQNELEEVVRTNNQI